ncbi:MAG: tetratricopeptide repeat protein [Myxococcales bacterium]|nr:tetratricopeptide repeat protein [Myxococcales bacterium]
MRTAGLLTIALLAAHPSLAESAMDLNTRGFRLYQQGRYPEALELFRQAFLADERHALAHYNYAATLGVLRKRGEVCEHSAFKSDILAHLEAAVALDPRRRARMQRDPDFDPVRDTIRYQRLLGRDPSRARDGAILIEQVSWFAPPQGAFGSMLQLDFQAVGRVVGWRMVMGPEDAAPTKVDLKGRYTVRGSAVALVLDKPLEGKKSFEGVLGPNGTLSFPEPIGDLTDLPSECDA